MLASFIRDRHKQQGKEEERGENQRFVEKLKLEGKIDEETAKRLIERK